MSIISHRSVIIVLLLTILVFVESNSNEFDAEEESHSKSLVRQRRQVTVPKLVNALEIFLEQLLTSVSNLLFTLGGSLPIILGGLGLALDVIVSQPSSATADCAQVVTKLNTAETAATNINKLAPVAQNLNVTAQLTTIENSLNTILNLLNSPNPLLATIQSTLNGIITNLNNAVGQIQSTINTLVSTISSNAAIIFQGLSSPTKCILLQQGTVGFGNITGQALISCVPNPTG